MLQLIHFAVIGVVIKLSAQLMTDKQKKTKNKKLQCVKSIRYAQVVNMNISLSSFFFVCSKVIQDKWWIITCLAYFCMDSNEKHNYIEYLLDCRNRRRTVSRFQYVDVDTWILFTLQPRDNAAIIKFALCFSFKQFI